MAEVSQSAKVNKEIEAIAAGARERAGELRGETKFVSTGNVPASDAQLKLQIQNETKATALESFANLLDGSDVGKGLKDTLSSIVDLLPEAQQIKLGLAAGLVDFAVTDIKDIAQLAKGLDDFASQTRVESAAWAISQLADAGSGDLNWFQQQIAGSSFIQSRALNFDNKLTAFGEIFDNRNEIFAAAGGGLVDGLIVENIRRGDLAIREFDDGNFFEAGRQAGIVAGRTVSLALGVGALAKLGAVGATKAGGALVKLFGKYDSGTLSAGARAKLLDKARANVDDEASLRNLELDNKAVIPRGPGANKAPINGGTVIKPNIEEHILLGHRKALTGKNKKNFVGGHSPTIKNDPDFSFESITANADGSHGIKKIRRTLSDGTVLKKSFTTLFPDKWSSQKILDSITEVASFGKPLVTRTRDNSTLIRGRVDGVDIEVIKIGKEVQSGFPTGGQFTSAESFLGI